MLSPQTSDLSYRRLAGKGKSLQSDPGLPQQRIAILSDAASQQFEPILRALLHENQLSLHLYQGAFDSIELEVLNPTSGLYQARPNVIVIATCVQAIRVRALVTPEQDDTLERLRKIWSAIRANSDAHILQFNFALPLEQVFGNFDVEVESSAYALISRLNTSLAAAAADHSGVTLIDIDRISSTVGRGHWFDDRLWYLSKAFCRLDHLPLVCQSIVDVTLTLMGKVVKCLVLDLDNTLWGGIVGDVGHLGIEIGAHGDGEPFYHFQSYLLALKRRGILLAVCSKNELNNAIRPFDENPNMVLHREDIAVFVANWENKADNIQRIRDRLNIGLDSMVFLDDNPFERNLVRELLPQVIVPEMPDDPADYVHFLSGLNLFEATTYSHDDARRAERYRLEAERTELRNQATDVGTYLKSLVMRIHVARFDPDNIARIAQLTQRSNQFNLTTVRLSEGQCRDMMLDPQWMPIYASLSDRLGDHGIIGVITLQYSAEAIRITNWLMSCRVLARGVEEYLMSSVVSLALKSGLSSIEGEYAPSAKNAMVKDFYQRFGFELVSDTDGHTCWKLDPRSFVPPVTHIQEI